MYRFYNKWNKSIFYRLLLTFLVILIPIYAMGISIYKWGMNTVEEEISKSMISQVSFYLNNLETEIQQIKMLQYDCLTDDDLNTLSVIPDSMNTFEKSRAVLRLQNRLHVLMNSSVYIKNTSAYIPLLQKTITVNTDVNLDLDELNMFKYTQKYTGSPLIFWKNRIFLAVMYPSKINNINGNPSYIIASELSEKSIGNSLGQFNNNLDSGTLLMNSTMKNIIESGSNQNITNQIVRLLKTKNKESLYGTGSIKVNGKSYIVTWSSSKYLDITLVKYFPQEDVFGKIKKYQVLFWIFTLVVVIIIVLFSVSTYKFIHQPLVNLAKAFKKVENGDLNISIKHKNDDEFGYIYGRFNLMVGKLNILIDQVYKQKILAQRAELKQLQSQINPHFLYNSFFILYRMAKIQDYDNVTRFAHQLGNYFQFITRSGADEVSLEKEVNHARIYTEIQILRFSKRIKAEFDDLPDRFKDVMVPRLILQPIIENAFEHGLENKVSDGLIFIKFKEIEESLYIIIEDNGEGLNESGLEKLQNSFSTADENLEITGILNINRRIKLKFGPSSGVNISIGKMGGMRVELVIDTKGEVNKNV